MTKLEEILAGASIFLVFIGGFMMIIDGPKYIGDISRMMKFVIVGFSGHTLFSLTTLKMMWRHGFFNKEPTK